ncbi:gamma carbonic anhydrase family protein [Oceanobacillus timonensis]|uniref:gamma carbonic anhydrase family protein n=1 Tax=Oceanobacillus timonensis TaxID=1926285 RepID=UPI0009BB66C7|nr:gamma carbonic anhydrase family protein [Oceanobacillus timonensis]
MIRSIREITPTIHPNSYLDEASRIIGDVRIGENVSVWPFAVLRGDDGNYIDVGEGSNIQDNSVCHVTKENPLIIGKNVTIGHGVILHACTIEDEARIGMGATILDGAVIKKGAQVGANALVTSGKVIPSGTVAMGVPAKVIRELNEDEKKDIKMNSEEYVKLWNSHYDYS